MAQLPTLCAVLACVLVYVSNRCEGSRVKVGVKCAAADVDPEDCVYGTTKDFCGKIVCAKGPGMICGGPSHVLGRCGEGMQCKCERCTGCSLHTLKCDFSEFLCLD